jgi:hypothetical protein
MSAVFFDRIRFETEATQVAPESGKRPREEEFRAALDRYMSAYIDRQKRRAEATEVPADMDSKQTSGT